MIDVDAKIREYAELINKAADEYVSCGRFSGRESGGLDTMLEAMSYSLRNRGKRIRP